MKALVELGKRVRHQRIAAEWKQRELADRAAVSLDSVSALENGRPVKTDTLARIFQALGRADALENLLPAPTVSPLELQKLQGRQRRRVR
ncbi:MAG: helix-turn-helix transcriptional regulator [Verrucomicrobiota bacterium]